MKRKLLLSSALVPALLASGAMGQVVNFHDAANNQLSFPGVGYEELFAGQGAYADPGNDIWNGFGQYAGYQSTYFYSGSPIASGGGGPWPQQSGNPGNPYAAFFSGGAWTISTGTSLFDFSSGGSTTSGNATSDGQLTPITLSPGNYGSDNGLGTAFQVPNGSPSFLLGMAAYDTGTTNAEVFTLQNVPAGTYGLYLYGVDYLNERGTLFSVNSGSAHNGIAATLNNGIGQPADAFVEGQNFVIFEGVTPDASGNITITATTNPQNGVGNNNLPGDIFVNGFQLIFSPPPTAVGSTAAQNLWAGDTANFSFSPAFATGASFRWQSIIGGVTKPLSDGGNISGSGTAHLTISNVSAADAGLYQCVITTATATGKSPAAPLTLLTSTAASPLQPGNPTTTVGYILQPGDPLSDFPPNSVSAPYNSIPSPFVMTAVHVEDGSLNQYVNFGANGSTPPFLGPVGIVVTPNAGSTIVTGMRLFTASSHPESDPADYLLEGSSDGGHTFKAIAGGLLGLPAQRNAAGGAINITNQVLQEIDFANSSAYSTYRLTFTNVNDNDTSSNGLQIAEIQFLGSLPPLAPGIVQEPVSSNAFFVGETFQAGVTVSGSGPLTYQWYYNTTTPVPNANSAILTVPNVQPSNAGNYTCTISNPNGSTNSTIALLNVLTSPPAVIGFNSDGTDWTFNQATNPTTFWPGSATTPGVVDNVLTIIDGNNGEATGSWFDTPQLVGSFIVSFTFQFTLGSTGTPADGMTFCVQNNTVTNADDYVAGVNTVGGAGGGIGFSQIGTSAALELNDYINDHGGEGFNFGTDGNVPDNDAQLGNFFSTSPVVLTNGDPINIQFYYTPTGATLSMVDTVTGDTFNTNVSVPDLTAGYYNKTSIVGGRSAFIGFTGGTGALNSTLTASNLVYSYTTPPILSIAPGGTKGSANVTWPISVATMFGLHQSTTLNGPWTKVTAPVIVNSQYRNQVTVTPGTSTAFYRLSLQ